MKRIVMALVAVALMSASGRAEAQGFIVVVNAANPASELSKGDVSNAFMKKGSQLVAVDLDKASAVRDAFSKAIHGRPAAAVLSHWQQQIFAGRDVPPPERASDAEVLAFVRGNPNGIGYVAAGTSLGEGVKAVAVK
jgi:ABC-type phosphate transport system substrate-binding protein